jgi:hypothetical protein
MRESTKSVRKKGEERGINRKDERSISEIIGMRWDRR